MANLNRISAENMGRAAAIMEAVSGVRPAPRVDYPPYVEEAVAGAVMALEKGHPHALRLTRATKAEDWLDPRSIEGPHLQRAVARVLGGYEPGAMVDMSPKGLMEHIVTDTVNTTLAARMDIAVRDRSPVMTEGMTERQIGRVEAGRRDGAVTADILHEMRGDYDRVSRSRRLELIDVFHEKENVSQTARDEIERASAHVDGIRSASVAQASGISSRIADFREAGEPLFRDVVSEDARREVAAYAEDLALGIGKGPMNQVEAGVQAHVAVKGPMLGASHDGLVHDARVAVMVDAMLTARAQPEAPLPSPADVAMRIDGLATMMRQADDYAYSYARATDNDPVKSQDMELLARGEVSSMSPDAQIGVFTSLHSGDRVPALTAMRIHGAVSDMSVAERSVGIDRSVPNELGYAQAAMAAQARGMAR
jgi:hypothetical protein